MAGEHTAGEVARAARHLDESGFVPLTSVGDLDGELAEVRGLLEDAMVIEHATIPAYLTMLYTLDERAPWRITEVVRSVVVEEMMHLVLVGNVLTAVGGRPRIDRPGFILDYPSALPLGIDGLVVGLLPFSKAAVDQGRAIERPAPVRPQSVLGADFSQMTIGEFYAYIESRLRAIVAEFGSDAVFTGDPGAQIPARQYYYDGGGAILEVDSLGSAVRALRLITAEGEGAHHSVWTGPESAGLAGFREPAHFFRFDELARERCYRQGDTVDSGPTGEELYVPWESAVRTWPDATLADYGHGEVRRAVEAFNRSYCTLLRQVQAAFEGRPEVLQPAVVGMCRLRDAFRALTANPFPGRPGVVCAPTFDYVPAAG